MDSAGFKQADLVHAAEQRGEKLGRSQISQYVAGKSTPRREVLELLASLLAVEPDWLEGEPGQAEPSATTSPAQSQPASFQQQDSNPLDSSNPTDNQGASPCVSSRNPPSSTTCCTTSAVPLLTKLRA
ncbi:MAG: helix-turn-helix domain-containing protein [Senegalimassilia faecalis]